MDDKTIGPDQQQMLANAVTKLNKDTDKLDERLDLAELNIASLTTIASQGTQTTLKINESIVHLMSAINATINRLTELEKSLAPIGINFTPKGMN